MEWEGLEGEMTKEHKETLGGDGHVNYLVGMVLPACTYVKI